MRSLIFVNTRIVRRSRIFCFCSICARGWILDENFLGKNWSGPAFVLVLQSVNGWFLGLDGNGRWSGVRCVLWLRQLYRGNRTTLSLYLLGLQGINVTPVGVEKRVSLSGGRACCRRVNKRSLVGKRARGCCSVGFSVDGEGSCRWSVIEYEFCVATMAMLRYMMVFIIR